MLSRPAGRRNRVPVAAAPRGYLPPRRRQPLQRRPPWRPRLERHLVAVDRPAAAQRLEVALALQAVLLLVECWPAASSGPGSLRPSASAAVRAPADAVPVAAGAVPSRRRRPQVALSAPLPRPAAPGRLS